MAISLHGVERALVLAPHTDDGELGCGATIHKLQSQGTEVHYVAFSSCEESVPKGFAPDVLKHELLKATAALGIANSNVSVLDFRVRRFHERRQDLLEHLVQLNKSLKPDLIFCPSRFDVHQDHSVVHDEARRAFKNNCLLGYEFVWNCFSFEPSFLVAVDEAQVNAKINALNEYASQRGRAYTSAESIRTAMHFRGLQIGKRWAEAFELIRWIAK